MKQMRDEVEQLDDLVVMHRAFEKAGLTLWWYQGVMLDDRPVHGGELPPGLKGDEISCGSWSENMLDQVWELGV